MHRPRLAHELWAVASDAVTTGNLNTGINTHVRDTSPTAQSRRTAARGRHPKGKKEERTASAPLIGSLALLDLCAEVFGEAYHRRFSEDPCLFAELLNEFPSLVIHDLRFQIPC